MAATQSTKAHGHSGDGELEFKLSVTMWTKKKVIQICGAIYPLLDEFRQVRATQPSTYRKGWLAEKA